MPDFKRQIKESKRMNRRIGINWIGYSRVTRKILVYVFLICKSFYPKAIFAGKNLVDKSFKLVFVLRDAVCHGPRFSKDL
jgi:hypothetical protein